MPLVRRVEHDMDSSGRSSRLVRHNVKYESSIKAGKVVSDGIVSPDYKIICLTTSWGFQGY